MSYDPTLANTEESLVANLKDQLQASMCAEAMNTDIIKAQKARIDALEKAAKAIVDCDNLGLIGVRSGLVKALRDALAQPRT